MARHDRKTEEVLEADPQSHKITAYSRQLQILLSRRDFRSARQMIDQAEDELAIKKVHETDHPATVFDVRTSNALERAGYYNLISILNADGDDLRAIEGLDDLTIHYMLSELREKGFSLSRSLLELLNRAKLSRVGRIESH